MSDKEEMVVCNSVEGCVARHECDHASPHVCGSYTWGRFDACTSTECDAAGRKVRCVKVKEEKR